MSTNRKASIRKLSAKQLSILVNQPDLGLDKLHAMKLNLVKVNCQKIEQYEGNEYADDLNLLQVSQEIVYN